MVSVVVLVGAGGWFAGTRVHSPADVAASQQPPKPGPVTVAVERRSLTATVVATGSVQFASPQAVSLAGSVGAGDEAGDPKERGGEQRITRAPSAGTTVAEGEVLMEVNGRPVWVLRGRTPMYRTIGPQTSGKEVSQLQRALRRLHFEPGAVNGTFGDGTASAVARWYRSKGYQPQQPTAADQQRRGQLRQDVFTAQTELLAAQSADGAQAADTERGGTTPKTAPPTPSRAHDEEAQALRLRAAREALDTAKAALTAFERGYGTKIPAGEVVFLPDLPARLEKVTVRAGDAATGQIATVTSSDLQVRAVLPRTDAKLLRRGMAADVQTTDGKTARGTVDAIGKDAADLTGPDGKDKKGTESGAGAEGQSGGSDASSLVEVRIAVPHPGPLRGAAGGSVKVTIEVGASQGAVLAVPLAAVRTSADGKARVRVVRDGRPTAVPVTVGLSAAGLVEVEPAGGRLTEGDQVVVGA
ncbi:peptidoglycan-binding protein [Streptomyces sp. NPDC001177]